MNKTHEHNHSKNMVITGYQHMVLSRALDKITNGQNISIEIHDTDESLRFMINWSAIGATDTRRAAEFACDMGFAIQVAEFLNRLNISSNVDWSISDGEELIGDFADKVALKLLFRDAEGLRELFSQSKED